MASTREPVGSRNLFRETHLFREMPDQSEQAEPRSHAMGRDEVASAEPSAMMLYLVCVAFLLIIALGVGFM